jgi:hypothetical protein
MPFGTSRDQGFGFQVLKNFAAGNIRINPKGLFVYSGAPGAGNLIGSISNAITDQYGNAVQAQVASYNPGNGTLAALTSGGIVLGIPGNNVVALFISPNGDVTLTALRSLDIASPVSSPIVASVPGTPGTTESWHAMTLLGGWTGTAEYKVNAVGEVTIATATALAAGTIANGTQIWQAPAGYVPAVSAPAQQSMPLMIGAVGTGSAPAAVSPFLLMSNTGVLTINGIAGQVATTIRFKSTYSLA